MHTEMDDHCGLSKPTGANLYFAYGSNLLEREVLRSARNAKPFGKAFLPRYRLEFTKHSISRGGDAANIRRHATSTVWGYVYQVHDSDRESLIEREKGYQERNVIVSLMDGEDVTQLVAFTFVASQICAKNCGPSTEYLALIVEGAKARNLPAEYRQALLLQKISP